MIEPRVLKGFRDFLPGQEIARRRMVEKIEASFRLFGFVPIDTPALEYAEILLGKGGGETEKQVYRFTDQGGREVAMRFDLTVPFARFIAEHRAELPLPFKRYHIAKVWRGENTQRGRYREFTQCDFDIVGSGCAGADFEILLMMRNTLAAAGAGGVTIRISHRGLFNRFLAGLGVADKSAEILRVVDKLSKIGKDAALEQLEKILDPGAAARVLEFTGAPARSYEETLAVLKKNAGEGPDTERLETLRAFMNDTGTAESFVLDPSITRGLDYYTGVVFETFLDALPGIGSVCSGGRYDNLTGLYSKEALSGVGASIGLDRLQAALETLEAGSAGETWTRAAIICRGEADSGRSHALASRLRAEGICCEVFLESKKPAQQFILAEKKGIPWAVLADEGAKTLTLRNIIGRKSREGLSIEEAAKLIFGRN
jgi:histidyl-tRNA synthetase